jgi:hypothetical protein
MTKPLARQWHYELWSANLYFLSGGGLKNKANFKELIKMGIGFYKRNKERMENEDRTKLKRLLKQSVKTYWSLDDSPQKLVDEIRVNLKSRRQ